MAGTRNETIVASKGEKARMESHKVSIVFGDDGGHVVEPELACHTGHGFERMDVTTHQSLKRLAVSKLEIHLPAVTFDQAEGIQLARCAVIVKRPEVTPVDFKTLARRGFHANEGAPGFRLRAHGLKVILDNRVASSEASIA